MGCSQQALSGFNAAAGGGSRPGPNALAPVFCCGFECGQIGTVGQHWGSASSNCVISTVTTRTGGRSLQANPSSSVRGSACVVVPSDVSVHRFYVRFTSLPTANTYLFWAGGATAARLGLAFKQSDSKLYCASGSTPTFAATGASVTTGVWYRVDVKLNQTSGAGAVDIQIDGVALTQQTNASTAGAVAVNFGIANSTSANVFFDDFVMSNTAADYPWGAGTVQHFVPVADGSHNITSAGDFKVGSAGANITNATTDSCLLIDDVPMDDTTPDTNDYINMAVDSGGGAEYVEHVIGPASGISTPVVGPRAVDVIYAYHAAGTGTGNHTLKVNDSGNEDTVNAFNAAGVTTIRYARKHYANAPSDGNAWDVQPGAGNFNNLKTRFGYSTDANPDQYLDCVMVEAEFA